MATDEPAPEVVTPRCPGCDSEPLTTLILPYFCPNDAGCKVIIWDPYSPGYLFKAQASIIDFDQLAGPAEP
jgi:hypothetical protein